MPLLSHSSPRRPVTLQTAIADWNRTRRVIEKRCARAEAGDANVGFFWKLFTAPTRFLAWLAGRSRPLVQTKAQESRYAFYPVKRQTRALADRINMGMPSRVPVVR